MASRDKLNLKRIRYVYKNDVYIRHKYKSSSAKKKYVSHKMTQNSLD